jgi:hypothetical protein
MEHSFCAAHSSFIIHHSSFHLPPEAELLLLCLRSHFGLDVRARIAELLKQDLRWNDFIRKAGQAGVMPLVCDSLLRDLRDQVPSDPRQILLRGFQTNEARNRFLTGELLRLLDLLERRDIAVIPLKGPVQAEVLYGNVALRQVGDLDILVRREDCPRALEALLAEGYEQVVEEVDYHYELKHPKSKVRVELHFGIMPSDLPFDVDVNSLWERAGTVPFAGRTVRCFSPEHQVLYFCVHATKHHWIRIETIFAMAKVLRMHSNFDWAWADDEAAFIGVERSFLLGLLLCEQLFGVELPALVRARIERNAALRNLAEKVREWIFTKEDERLTLPQEYTLSMGIRRNAWRQVLFLLKVAFVPTEKDRQAVPLPFPLSFLYPLVRIVRLLFTSVGRDRMAELIRHLRKH